jgi:hypothetical protein
MKYTEAKEPTIFFTSERHRAKELFYTGANEPTSYFTEANEPTIFFKQVSAIERKSYFTQEATSQRNFCKGTP